MKKTLPFLVLLLPVLSAKSLLSAADCNANGSEDVDDIAAQVSEDCDQNGVPDECERPPLTFAIRPENASLRINGLPFVFAVGDLDDDGRPDLVAFDRDEELSVLLNRGNERFELVTETPGADEALAMRLVDMNQDGFLDVVTAGDDMISVSLGDGKGGLGDALLTTEVGDLRGLGVTDLDGDGIQDCVSPDRRDSVVVVLLGHGDGTFMEPQRFVTGGRPTALVVADLDGDGDEDVMTGNGQTRDVSVLINDAGALGAPTAFSTDGRPLLLTTTPRPEGGVDLLAIVGSRIVRLRGMGDGTFAAVERIYESSGRIITAYAYIDLDGDQISDLVMARTDGTRSVVLVRGRADGSFAAPDTMGVDGFARQLEAEDLDGDGDRELIMVSENLSIGVLWQDATGVIPFETVAYPAVIQRPHSATSGDFNQDGLEDVITANGSDHGVTLFLNNGDGTLADGVTVPTDGYLNSIAAIDVEGDGDLDVVSVDPKSDILYVLENTDGQGAMGNLLIYPAGREPFMVVTGDVDEDGDPDAVVANASGADVSLSFNDGTGAFLSFASVPAGSRPVAVALADLDNDSHLDIAVSNSVSLNTTVLLGNGDATFAVGVDYPAPGRTLYVVATDLDLDNDLDLVSANENTLDRVSMLLNSGDGSFVSGGAFDSAQTPYSLLARDLDADGQVDVVTANQSPNSVSVLQGAGDGTFIGTAVFLVGDDPRFVMAVDLDVDGDQDLVAANHTSRNLTVLLNRSAESEFREDYLGRICRPFDFEAVSVPARSPADRVTKYLLAANDDPELLPPLFQNVSRYPLHQDFLSTVFPARFPALPSEEYNQLVGRRLTRRYFAGVIHRLRRPDGVAYGFNVVTDASDAQEMLEVDEVRDVFDRLREAFRLEPFGYFPDTAQAREAAASWPDPGFPVYLDESDEEITYEPYTNAVGYGRVRLLDAEGFAAAGSNGEVSFQSILVLDEAPSDIEGVVGGVITAQRQGELGQVAIRTARRGIPNAFVADAARVFAPYADKLVRLETRAGDFVLAEASLDEAEAFWAEGRPTLSKLPTFDGEFATLSSLAEIADMDRIARQESRFGAKATNLARLGRIFDGSEFEKFREIGFAIPVRYYLEFLRANRMPSESDPAREVTYEEYLEELFQSAEFRSDSKLRFQKLVEFRARARDEGVVADALVEAVRARIEEVFPSTRTPVRFRSSTNVEEALEFIGAGLYESTGGCVDDDLDEDDEGPSLCDPSKDTERGIRRALKIVWTSLHTFRAFEERAFYGIPEDTVAMGVLVSRAFPDERANGFALTGNDSNPLDRRYVVTVQLGEESVLHPDPGVIPEKDILEFAEGRVAHIVRPVRGSTLVEPGAWILSDTHLQEMGAVLAFVDERFPLELGDYPRDQVLLDLEFKLEPDDTLAFKQVRPFLVSAPAAPAPEFALKIPEDVTICGVFGVAGADRGPFEEYVLKSTMRLRAGVVPLTTSADSFEAPIIEEVLFGRTREAAQAVTPGRFRVQTIPQPDDTTVYRFLFEQSFVLANGSSFEVRGVTPLRFVGRGAEALSAPLELDDVFFTVLASREAFQATLDGETAVRYGSCDYDTLASWEVSAELEDGTTLRLEERYEEAESLNDTAPATIVGATVELGGETRVVTDYFDLVYSAFRHNTEVRYWVVLDPPVELAGLTAPVHVIELIAPEPTEDVEVAVNYRDAKLAVLGSPGVRVNGRRSLAAPVDVSFRRGDVNADGGTNITDGVHMLEFLFRRGDVPPCVASADIDGSGRVNLLDAIVLLRHITEPGGPIPAAPFDDCGLETESTELTCESFAPCEAP